MLKHRTERSSTEVSTVDILTPEGHVVATLEQVRAATHRYQRRGSAETFRTVNHAKQVLEDRIKAGRIILPS